MCYTVHHFIKYFDLEDQQHVTYNAQSTAMMRVMSSVGNPTDVSTITMVTSPACGMPAAPILAAVAVILDGVT